MAEEISNKTLAVIVVAAIVVTLGSTALILRMGAPVVTGMATESGTAEFNITSVVSIRMVDNLINWGDGAVDAGEDYAWVDSEGNSGNDTAAPFTTQSNGLIVENDGNVDVNLTVASSKDASTFPGGDATNRDFEWKIKNPGTRDNTGTCAISTYADVATTNTSACSNLTSEDSGDRVELDLYVQIPSDVAPGSQSTTIYFVAESAEG